MCGLSVIARLRMQKKRLSQSFVYRDGTLSQTPAIHIRAFEIPSTRSAPRLRPRDRSRALASTRSDACTLPPSPPPRTARIRPRAPTIRRREYSARMTSRARHRWMMMMRSRSRRRTIDRPRRCARRRRSRCDDANACDEISIARCDRAYLWKVSSDRAAKCRSRRDSHRSGFLRRRRAAVFAGKLLFSGSRRMRIQCRIRAR